MALAVGCRTAPPPRPGQPPPSSPHRPPSPGAAGVLVGSAYRLLGTPYRHAGADPRGFDCSGLTSYLFSGVGLALPRRAEEQAAAGRWVPLDELAAGDLVFFAVRAKPNHVGLVVSAPGEPLRMIHASSSRGVVETEVTRDRYWLERLRFGRRVLPGG